MVLLTIYDSNSNLWWWLKYFNLIIFCLFYLNVCSIFFLFFFFKFWLTNLLKINKSLCVNIIYYIMKNSGKNIIY